MFPCQAHSPSGLPRADPIVGGGFFEHYSDLPISLAWQALETAHIRRLACDLTSTESQTRQSTGRDFDRL